MGKLGCMVIHGWSANPNHVICLEPRLQTLGLPCRFPQLRGHGTRPEDMRRLKWQDWYADVEEALDELLRECEQVVLVGHSMGGLLALLLAANRPQAIAGVVAVAAPMRVASPLFPLSPYLAPLLRRYRRKIATGYSVSTNQGSDATYRWVPASAVAELYRISQAVEPRLPAVQAPLLLIYSLADRVVSAESAEIIYRTVASEEKRIIWFQRSGHEMFLDCEANEVTATIEAYIASKAGQKPAQTVV